MMKRYVEIFWCPSHVNIEQHSWVEVAYAEPKRFYPLLLTQRKDADYLRCPAFSENFKNSFVITAPYDLNISFDYNNKIVGIDRYGQRFFDNFILNRRHKNSAEIPFLFSISIDYLFFAYEAVEIETKDVPLLTSDSTKNIKVVPGKFDISKWLRPIEFAAEVIDHTQLVTLKLGDPLFMVNFITKNNVPVKLTRILNTPELHNKTKAFPSLKRVRPRLNLKECYAAADGFITTIKRWYKF